MTTATASLFFAILSLAALTGAVALTILLVAGRGMAPGAGRDPLTGVARLRADLATAALPVAWIVATVTTLGSLYYSEIAHFVPCALCWYQRIAVYPLVLLLGIAALRRDRAVRIYVIAQCAVGAVIATYHAYIQAFPPETGTSFCTAEAPCTTRYVWELGFVSLPFMALTAFLFIITLMIVAGPADRPDDADAEPLSTADDLAPGDTGSHLPGVRS